MRPFVVDGTTVALSARRLKVIRSEPYRVPSDEATARGYTPRTLRLHYPLTLTGTRDAMTVQGERHERTIRARKEAGAMTHLIAICSTGIMIDQMQLTFKVDDDNRIARFFPGMEGFETSYVRCFFGEGK